jgi:hypothetical protein
MKLVRIVKTQFYKLNSIAALIHDDGSKVPLYRGEVVYPTSANVNQDLWEDRVNTRPIPCNKQNLRAYAKQMRKLPRASSNCSAR